MSGKTSDKSVIKCIGFCGFGMGANITEVDVKDGKVARIRPLHYDQLYKPEDLNYWKIERNGHVLEPGMVAARHRWPLHTRCAPTQRIASRTP